MTERNSKFRALPRMGSFVYSLRSSTALRYGLDVGFLAMLVSALFFGGDLAWLLVVFGVLPIPLYWFSSDYKDIWQQERRPLVSLALYFAYCLFCLYAFTGIPSDGRQPVNPDAELYLLSVAFFAIGLLRSFQIRDIGQMFHNVVPVMLATTFLLLSFYRFSGLSIDCRVYGEANLPFIPALLFSTFSLLLLLDWTSLSRKQQLQRLALLAAAIIVCVGYTGSRGVSVGLGFVLACLCLGGRRPSLRGHLPRPGEVILVSVAGLVISLLVDFITGCGMFQRLAAISATAANLAQDLPQPGADASISLRLEMWSAAFHAFLQHPIFGNGLKSEFLFISAPFGFEHAHNQFLSWLANGGVIFLTLGLLFLASPVQFSRSSVKANDALVLLATSVLWGGSMLFDSFLSMDFFLHFYMLLVALVFALRQSKNRLASC